MGSGISIFGVIRVGITKKSGKRIDDINLIPRRRNSHACNIEAYKKLNGGDTTALLRLIEYNINRDRPIPKGLNLKKIPKFTQIGNDVLHGNMR